ARAVDELYALLRERRDDDLFWLRLSDLAGRLEDQRFSADALSRADAIDGSTVNRLLEDLRSSLGTSAPRRTLKDWLGAAISGAALAGFVLLGAATCSSDDNGLCDEADEEGFQHDNGEVYCDLIEIIENADVSAWVKTQLLDCLPELDASYRATLLEQFQSMSESELADHLEAMAGMFGICGSGADTDTDTH
ncbi:MAG: hypothetical protein JRF63_08470, partial [Deltaproteobacteria bacterium]|nr:hypothetical protein [Deltaproteobacteria bacterium]